MLNVGDWPSPRKEIAGCKAGALSRKVSVALNRYGNSGVKATFTAHAPPGATVAPVHASLVRLNPLSPESVTAYTESGCGLGLLKVTNCDAGVAPTTWKPKSIAVVESTPTGA